MTEVITSVQNPKIKQLLALQEKSRLRRETGLFLVEGQRELQRCIDCGYEIDSIFYCKAICGLPVHVTTGGHSFPEKTFSGCNYFEVSEEVYRKIAYREGTEGVIAEVRVKERKLEDLALKENPLIVVLESVEKPGNIGAVLRTADAAGVDAVIVCDPLTDLYNPNLIRASLGGFFSVPTVACSSEEVIAWLKKNNIQILTAQLQDSSLYYNCDMKKATAIVMGTEATGLTDVWRKAADAHIRIPMLGKMDSLNVSVSAAILMFEAVRQRQ